MRSIFLVLSILFSFSYNAKSQIEIEKKPVTILSFGTNLWESTLKRVFHDSDTFYLFTFRDVNYKELIELKSIDFTKKELKDFGKSLALSLSLPKDQEIKFNHIILENAVIGFNEKAILLYYDHAFTYVKEKNVQKLIDTINNEL